jgi:gephyrin
MASGPLKAALLIVSTTAAKDASADASGPILTQVLKDEGDGKWEVHDTKIVTDDVLAIQRQITAWTDGPDSVNLVVTTGGTGFATGDSTPEVRLPY